MEKSKYQLDIIEAYGYTKEQGEQMELTPCDNCGTGLLLELEGYYHHQGSIYCEGCKEELFTDEEWEQAYIEGDSYWVGEA